MTDPSSSIPRPLVDLWNTYTTDTIKPLQDRIAELERHKKEYVKINRILADRNEKLVHKVNELKDAKNLADGALANANKELQAKDEEWQSRLSRDTEALQTKHATELQVLEGRLSQVLRNLATSNQNVVGLQAASNELAKAHKEEVERMEKEWRCQHSNAIDSLQKKHAAELEDLEESFDPTLKRLEDEFRLNEAERDAREREAESEHLKAAAAQELLEKTKEMYFKKIDSLKQTIKEKDSALEEKVLEEKRLKRAPKNTEASHLLEQVESLKAAIQEKDNILTEKMLENERLRSELESRRREYNVNLLTTSQQLSVTASRKRHKADSEDNFNNVECANCKTLKSYIEVLRGRNAELESELEGTRKTNDTLVVEINTTAAKLQTAEKQCKKLKKTETELEATKKAVEHFEKKSQSEKKHYNNLQQPSRQRLYIPTGREASHNGMPPIPVLPARHSSAWGLSSHVATYHTQGPTPLGPPWHWPLPLPQGGQHGKQNRTTNLGHDTYTTF